jgi:hypothetical protein
MADSQKYHQERPAFLFLGSAEDLESIPRSPGLNLHFHSCKKDREIPCIIGIVSEDPAVIEGWIRWVRGNSDLALLPLVVFSSIKNRLREMTEVDGVYPPVFAKEILLGILKEWGPLRGKIDTFSPLSAHLPKRESARLVLLRYLSLRDLEKLEPIRNIQSRTGYSYPVAEMILLAADFDECEVDLNMLENRGFLQSEFADTVHLCGECGFFQLNFREVCPSCRSANLAEERNIHHFRCGYVGCETEFTDMRCPKCRRRLKHIGVDYDLPSASFCCLSCEDVFGEPLVACLCFKCGRDFPVEEAIRRIVRSYVLTSEGKRLAWDPHRESSVKSESGLLEFSVFKELFSVQAAIAKRSAKSFSLILVRGKSGEGIESNSDPDSIRQLAAAMKKTMRDQDVMAPSPRGGVLVLATDTSKEETMRIAERFRNLLAGSFAQPSVIFVECNQTPLEEAMEKLYTQNEMNLYPFQTGKS